MYILGIDHVVIRCVYAQRMMNFYCYILGCTLEKSREDLGLYHVRAGRSLIDLITVSGRLGQEGGGAPIPNGRNMDHFCLRIDSFHEETLRSHFKTHGIEL